MKLENLSSSSYEIPPQPQHSIVGGGGGGGDMNASPPTTSTTSTTAAAGSSAAVTPSPSDLIPECLWVPGTRWPYITDIDSSIMSRILGRAHKDEPASPFARRGGNCRSTASSTMSITCQPTRK
ncbi:hypothetical protein DFA_11820 [Cavenderia fasciculata]|uniref:Uncharacterized protein n=1 Tax=Cavenderia fasciculata TaxID=261658 RepID=F4QEB0_CACFS|nr:uncharacterized protein DFA_11820 [Cavenderia fasciculata]EGG14057.1 hypothetical protein DFA_11820 [Cavenderia fasciculata]|eukprot:XP_004350765.1 hypothetical protein DFA_11820 [Cavenderia fasciculata]